MIIVSACLAEINCKYNGKNNLCPKILKLVQIGKAIPVCPEQLGGLTTPRKPAEIFKNKVVTNDGKNITKYFLKGAKETLKIAKFIGAQKAILKSKSPSCSCGLIYDDTFTGKLIKGDGITTSLLKRHGIKVMNEEDINKG